MSTLRDHDPHGTMPPQGGWRARVQDLDRALRMAQKVLGARLLVLIVSRDEEPGRIEGLAKTAFRFAADAQRHESHPPIPEHLQWFRLTKPVTVEPMPYDDGLAEYLIAADQTKGVTW